MDTATARRLSALTDDFYRCFAGSFSDTRQSAWAGWDRCLQLVRDGLLDGGPAGAGVPAAPPAGAPAPGGPSPAGGVGADRAPARDSGQPLLVLDLACGNLRFERYLAQAIAPARARFYAVDNCEALLAACAPVSGAASAAAPLDVRVVGLDIMEALFADMIADSPSAAGPVDGAPARNSLSRVLDVPPCDLSVCFGFLHHVPLPDQRAALLAALAEKTRPGGLVIASFWRFLDDAAFARRARAQHARASVELGLPPLSENDCVLGWQNDPTAHRYCHSFTDAEIDELVDALRAQARAVARFRADGKGGAMNEYVAWRVR